ncbi:MAG: hypothetical protein ACE5QW_08635 [Thermoplasmata archaeon]
MRYELRRIGATIGLIFTILVVSMFPLTKAATYTTYGWETTEVHTSWVDADAGGSNYNLDVDSGDTVYVEINCFYNDTRGTGALSKPAIHYFNVTATYGSETKYDDLEVETHWYPESGEDTLSVSFQVQPPGTIYVYEYVNVTLYDMPLIIDFDEAWFNWTILLY